MVNAVSHTLLGCLSKCWQSLLPIRRFDELVASNCRLAQMQSLYRESLWLNAWCVYNKLGREAGTRSHEAMALKQLPWAAPPWQRSSAKRIAAFALALRKEQLPRTPAAAAGYVPPSPKWEWSASSSSSHPARPPKTPHEELWASRVSCTVASSFNPARHAVMVAGRPVVAVLKQTSSGCVPWVNVELIACPCSVLQIQVPHAYVL